MCVFLVDSHHDVAKLSHLGAVVSAVSAPSFSHLLHLIAIHCGVGHDMMSITMALCTGMDLPFSCPLLLPHLLLIISTSVCRVVVFVPVTQCQLYQNVIKPEK